MGCFTDTHDCHLSDLTHKYSCHDRDSDSLLNTLRLCNYSFYNLSDSLSSSDGFQPSVFCRVYLISIYSIYRITR